MALKCGVNSRTYEPTGDGFGSDLLTAMMRAGMDFFTSLARVLGKLATYAAQPCPVGCRPKTVATPDTYRDPVFDVTWRRGRCHVRIGFKITRTVTCGKAASKSKPKSAKPKSAKSRTAKPNPGTRQNSRSAER